MGSCGGCSCWGFACPQQGTQPLDLGTGAGWECAKRVCRPCPQTKLGLDTNTEQKGEYFRLILAYFCSGATLAHTSSGSGRLFGPCQPRRVPFRYTFGDQSGPLPVSVALWHSLRPMPIRFGPIWIAFRQVGACLVIFPSFWPFWG